MSMMFQFHPALQQKALFQNFMDSLLQKSSKLRALAKDLKKNYKMDSSTLDPNPFHVHLHNTKQ